MSAAGGVSSDDGRCYDVVVLTASDNVQQRAFEEQLESMKDQLPTFCEYVVVADPPGAKIGNGGSTMEVVSVLDEKYGEKLKNYRVLLIHAGGFSQRLPHVSVLGKAFGLVPIGDRVMTCLEFCMEVFSVFPKRMLPGIFLCCADVLLDFKYSGDWAFDRKGFTALAHPSPLEIGTTHGVFVLKNPEEAIEAYNQSSCDVRMESCRCFLHKPSIDVMQSKGAVAKGSETIFTDSTFFFDYDTAMLLCKFYRANRPLLDEIDAYGDFLQALGEESSDAYTTNVVNVSKATDGLVKMRQDVYNLLSTTDLHTLLMFRSAFYHIGTTKEYIHHFTNDPVLRRDLKLRSAVEVATVTTEGDRTNGDGDAAAKKAPLAHSFPNQCLMACLFEHFDSCTISPHVVLEYCHIGRNVSVGENSIVSRAHCADNVSIPAHSFLHTIDVKTPSGQHGYVTVALGIHDSTKAKAQADRFAELKYAGKTLGDVASCLHLPADDIRSLWSAEETNFSLWTVRLFPIFATASSSLSYGVAMLSAVASGTPLTTDDFQSDILDSPHRYGMFDVLKNKDTQPLLCWRKDLRLKIASAATLYEC
ncbi:fucose-1-phosphate guanylyltransferase-like [Sycon ciliatum]|uniref:fucose-1-phosphate guanylyltransferase-like n=1 Tax=Sycon ciliatum TaxID=27933 RepID=UPI0031F63077